MGHTFTEQKQLAHTRLFSTSAARAKEDDPATPTAETASASAASEDSTETAPAAEKTAESAPDETIPWYLRVAVPKHATLTPQTTPLPAIPHAAPALMAPLVTFAADDLGLDDLKIMDLRRLDPPAALGPDLIMLFSTARSERHLHVSADRLVRWLRTYGVHASADGLLGRNELKIKLKRKARRAKLLGNIGQLAVGGADTDEVDDGISTKWVCVNAGFVGGRAKGKETDQKEKEGEESSVVDAQGRTTGFGSARSAGTTVVVQIFTAAKRKQMELEQLWARTLWHSLRKRRSAGEDVQAQLTALEAEMETLSADADKDGEEWLASLPSAGSESAAASAISSTTAAAAAAAAAPSGARFFSTSARRLAVGANVADVAGTAPTSASLFAMLGSDQASERDLQTAEYRLARSRQDKIAMLAQLARYVDQQATTDDVVRLVGPRGLAFFGNGTDGTDSHRSDFVDAARFCMEGLAPRDTWAFRAAVQAKLLCVSCYREPGIVVDPAPLDGMAALVAEMQRGGLACDRALALSMLRGLTTYGGDRAATTTALSLIRTLEARGEPVLAADLLATTISGLARFRAVKRFTEDKAERLNMEAAELLEAEATTTTERELATPSDRKTSDMYKAMARTTRDSMAKEAKWKQDRIRASQALPALEHLLRASLKAAGAAAVPPDEAALAQMLEAYMAADDWAQVWATWRLPVQHYYSSHSQGSTGRSAALYALLFQSAARTGDQARCMETLRFCVPEMLRETPPVSYATTAAVRRAMKACIRVADPGAEAAVGGMVTSLRTRRRGRADQGRGMESEPDDKRYSREFARLLAMIDA